MELEELQKEKHKDYKEEYKDEKQEYKEKKKKYKKNKQKLSKDNNRRMSFFITVIIPLFSVIISLLSLYNAVNAREDAKKAFYITHEMGNINTLREMVTKIQDIYAKNNGQNIALEDKDELTTIFNSVELIIDNNNYDSKFVSVKEKGEILKCLIYRYLKQMLPDPKPAVATGGEDRAELPTTGTLPDLESAFSEYKRAFMDYLSKYND